MDWKAYIISLTEQREAKSAKRDASFFPPLSQEHLSSWENEQGAPLPPSLRAFYLVSNGLEASRGEWWPIVPLEEVKPLQRDSCEGESSLLFVGHTRTHRFYAALDHRETLFVEDPIAEEPCVAAKNLQQYLQLLFKNHWL